MTKIYEVEPLVDLYQQIVPDDSAVLNSGGIVMDATPARDGWTPPKVRIINEQLKGGDFYGFTPGTLVMREQVASQLLSFLEAAGEVLPLSCSSVPLAMLNVTECLNCLDEEGCEWVYGKSSGKPIRITKYSFREDLLPESTIFKLPRFRKGRIYVSEGRKEPNDEFKYAVEKIGLEGLSFKLVWQS